MISTAALQLQRQCWNAVLQSYKTPDYSEALEHWAQAALVAEAAEQEEYRHRHGGQQAPWVRRGT